MEDFNGNTFVAFIDISGFKNILRRDTEKAKEVLTNFYQIGYNATFQENLNNNKNTNGLFVSDCGILYVPTNYVPKNENKNEIKESLESILSTIKKINIAAIKKDILLTTSIAYGQFYYENRISHEHIEKNLIFGQAYIDAFIDNEKKLKGMAGYCRITKNEIIDEIISEIKDDSLYIKKYKNSEKYYNYFYWMLKDIGDYKKFNNEYKECYNKKEDKWDCIKKLLKNYINNL